MLVVCCVLGAGRQQRKEQHKTDLEQMDFLQGEECSADNGSLVKEMKVCPYWSHSINGRGVKVQSSKPKPSERERAREKEREREKRESAQASV